MITRSVHPGAPPNPTHNPVASTKLPDHPHLVNPAMALTAVPTDSAHPTDPDDSLDDATSQSNSVLADARKLIAANADVYVKRLAEAVAVPSVSTDLPQRDHCFAMADVLHRWIDELGGRSEKVLVGFQELEDGNRYDLPPVILAEFHDGPLSNQKPTLLVYGHYDVSAPVQSHSSSSDPFTLTDRDQQLYAHGALDGKGPILAWLWAIEIFRELSVDLPVNLKFCIEGMQKSNSECLEDLLTREASRDGFLSDVDYLVLSDSHWLTPSKPCLTYGLRGLATFQCEVRAASKTLHSGQFGGCIAEPMTDIVQLLATVSRGGHAMIDIPGCTTDDLPPVTEAERDMYKAVTFDLDNFREEAGGVSRLIGDDATEVLMNRWRYPSLSIHTIEGASTGAGFETVIPGSAVAKFSIRLVPGQDAAAIEVAVTEELQRRFEELGSGNEMTITSSSSDAWLSDPKSVLYQAGAAAFLRVYGLRPDLTRQGGSIPVVGLLQKTLGAEMMLLPLAPSNDGEGSNDERIGRKNYMMGINVLFAMLMELGRVHETTKENSEVRRKRGAFGRLKDIWYGLS